MNTFFRTLGVSLAVAVLSSPAIGGLISSTGMSLPAGIVCVESGIGGERTEWQLKLASDLHAMTVRKVRFDGDDIVDVENLSGSLACESSRYHDESALENRCRTWDGRSMTDKEVFDIFPFRSFVHFGLKSERVPGGSLWKKFPKDACHVLADEKILPHSTRR